jgi:hypothetical protein
MARGRELALGLALGALAACGQPDAPGDIRTFAQYEVQIDATDQPDLNTGKPQRQLMFNFGSATKVTSPAHCASFGDASATFSGQPVAIPSPGGWVKNDIPTNLPSPQTVNGDHCYEPFIEVLFDNPSGEPQDGTLAIDGAGTHLEVAFDHPFGSPSIDLVSASSSQIVLSLQGFLFVPTLADIQLVLTNPVNQDAQIATQNTLGADGTLTLAVPAAAASLVSGASLLVSVSLGKDVVQCQGFESCSATSFFNRGLDLYVPFP